MRGHKTFLFISITTIVISKNILVLARGPLLLVPNPARPSSIQKKKEALADYYHHCQHQQQQQQQHQHKDQYDHDDPQHDRGDLKEDAQHHHTTTKSTTSFVGGINKKVQGTVIVVPSPTKEEEETAMLTKNYNNNVLPMNNDDRRKNHFIILLQEEEGSISNHAVASAVHLRGGGRRLRQLHKKQTRRFAFNSIISYIVLQKVMSCMDQSISYNIAMPSSMFYGFCFIPLV
jgi:hypothetical protein